MVRDRFPAIEKKLNAIAGKHPADGVRVTIQRPEQNRHVTKPTLLLADITENPAGRHDHFRFRVGALDQADRRTGRTLGRCPRFRVPIRDRASPGRRIRPMPFQVPQHRR